MKLPELPTYPQAAISVVVDGQDITRAIQPRVISISHTDKRGFEADELSLELDDHDGKMELPPRGAEIRFSIGWQASGLVDKGTFIVDGVRHAGAPDVLSISAKSADLRAGMTTQRERSWHDVMLGDIVRTIADENDLAAAITDRLAGEKIDHLDQTNESGCSLLTRLAKQFDAVSTVKCGRLLFFPAAGGVSVSGQPLPTVTINRESGDQHSFEIADRDTYVGVRATYNDVGLAVKGEVFWGKDEDSAERGKPVKTAASAPTTGQYKPASKTAKSRSAALRIARKEWLALVKNKATKAAYIGVRVHYDDRNLGVAGDVTYGQADEDAKRAKAMHQAEKDKAKAAPENAIEHSADNVKTLRHVYASKASATRAARAEWRKLQRGMARFSITLARPRPELFPEIPVTVSGFKRQIDGTEWIITQVNNLVNDLGYQQTIELEIRATEVPD